jgi:hypothetical protein
LIIPPRTPVFFRKTSGFGERELPESNPEDLGENG